MSPLTSVVARWCTTMSASSDIDLVLMRRGVSNPSKKELAADLTRLARELQRRKVQCVRARGLACPHVPGAHRWWRRWRWSRRPACLSSSSLTAPPAFLSTCVWYLCAPLHAHQRRPHAVACRTSTAVFTRPRSSTKSNGGCPRCAHSRSCSSTFYSAARSTTPFRVRASPWCCAARTLMCAAGGIGSFLLQLLIISHLQVRLLFLLCVQFDVA